MSVLTELRTQKDELKALIDLTPVGPQKSELRDQLDLVIAKLANYYEEKADAADQKYKDALAALQAANAEIRAAKEDLGRTAKVISKVALGMNFVQKVIDAAA
jgi:DNA repair exonuclease SbcCD ATPase subunit